MGEARGERPGIEHWRRLRRWQTRLIRTCDGIPRGLSREEAIDEVLAFFLLCYHLRDSLIRSGRSQAIDLDAFIDSSGALALCRDLTVGIKTITSAPLPPLGPSGQHYCEPVPAEQWLVAAVARSKDIFDLAVECNGCLADLSARCHIGVPRPRAPGQLVCEGNRHGAVFAVVLPPFR
jgi:hypothetical protein